MTDTARISPASGLRALAVFLFVALLAVATGRAAMAEPAKQGADLDALMEALLFREVSEVLAAEGRDMADDFAEAGYGVPEVAWREMLTRLYDPAVMARAFRREMGAALEGADLAPMVEFYRSDLGQRIARLELETRKALATEEAQAAAGEAWAELDPDTERARLIESYVQVNDLVELNVVGAMNSDIAYYRGLWMDGMPQEEGMTDGEILSEIWASEPEVRADVSEWVYGFSTLAYDTLSDAEFADYIAFARTEPGQRLNAALFAAFDGVYEDLSRGLGAGTARLMRDYEGEQL
ncbi:DUF2059 domain-containing protein [Celeribacter indicus]|uniref:DUF2059 domain-containing protein n=1 Tax=Celeribacter indicus TaxID=1208324 RepID=A0A0B5DVG8_9RHOB|nr:DUF2059 domain-containing protein [Celeribacter indicus]AJE47019.1 hypothetical protein P73_2304 [Celeribacter indicus]